MKKDNKVYVRLASAEKEKLERAAKKQGKTLSSWIRELITGKK